MTENNLENLTATKGDVALVKGDVALVKGDIALVKGDIKRLDQKVGQLDKSVLSLGIEVSKTQLRIDRLENRIMTALRSFRSEILSSIDAFAKEAQAYRNQDTIRGNTIMGHTEKLTNHETRIQKLEAK